MYTVIGSLQTRAFRVVCMLEELEQPYTLDPKRPRDPAVIALNPSGKVPVLVDDGTPIFDSVAICQYLADKHDRFTFPSGTINRAHQDSFTQFAVDDVEGPLWTVAKHTFVLPEEYRVADVKRACQFDFDRAMAGTREPAREQALRYGRGLHRTRYHPRQLPCMGHQHQVAPA